MQTETTQGGTTADATTPPQETAAVSAGIAATAPGQLRVIKRNGTVVPFEGSKISVAITKAFLAVEGGTAAASSRIHETVAKLTEQVAATFQRRMPSGGTIHIEDIQDQVELSLMRAGEHKIARDYVIYREEQARKRAAKASLSQETQEAANAINVILADGTRAPLDLDRLHTIVSEAASAVDLVSRFGDRSRYVDFAPLIALADGDLPIAMRVQLVQAGNGEVARIDFTDTARRMDR